MTPIAQPFRRKIRPALLAWAPWAYSFFSISAFQRFSIYPHPPSGLATGIFNGFLPSSKFLAVVIMHDPYSLPFHRLCRGLFSAFTIGAFALQAPATPVFEPVQGLVRAPEYCQAKLIRASDGSFYGTIRSGGGNGNGTVFQMTPTGVLTTLVNFTFANASGPGDLVQGSDGNFYGTTQESSRNDSGGGTMFKMTPTGTLTTLAKFTGANGSYPSAGLVQGSDGNLYGITAEGGSTADGQPAGAGQIFRLRMGPAGKTE